MEEVGAS